MLGWTASRPDPASSDIRYLIFDIRPSIPRSPLHVKNHASPTGRADQPLPLARVAKAERSATDAAHGHGRVVTRALRHLAARIRSANCLLLCRLEPRRFVRHEMFTTTLPNCSPVASRRNASAPFSSGYTLSTGGKRRPSRSSFTIASNSASLPMVEPRIDH